MYKDTDRENFTVILTNSVTKQARINWLKLRRYLLVLRQIKIKNGQVQKGENLEKFKFEVYYSVHILGNSIW